MQTNLHPSLADHPDAPVVESILRSCVHCGFCNATCPTYQALGDERDGPRGRIYLMKQFFETGEVTEATRHHLDRCLTCRNCETTCPSGVQYGKLADVGRYLIEQKTERGISETLVRKALLNVLPYPERFGFFLRVGQAFRPVLPSALKQKTPPKQDAMPWPANSAHDRKMLVLRGCAQAAATPNTNAAAANVFAKLGIDLIEAPEAGCCGAANYHLQDHDGGIDKMKANIDAWWPYVENGAEAIVMTASGCGAMVQEYGHVLRNDAAYAEKAAKISAMCRDISEILFEEDLSALKPKTEKVAVHCPCTLQHAMKQGGKVGAILQKLGFETVASKDPHLCCGSAGTYSVLQPKLAKQLGQQKVNNLTANAPDTIVTSNIGCQLHLGSLSSTPVKHWIELLV